MSFTEKVIIITGAGSGIGAHAAKHLAKLGASLCLVDQSEKSVKNVATEIETNGSSVQPLVTVADVTTDGERIISDAVKHFGKLDVLINIAGIYQTDNVNNFNIKLFDDMINTNLRSVTMLTSLAVPHLEKTKGNIVNMSSVLGMKAVTGNLSYSVSKAALDQFTRCAAIDLAPKGIRVNSINPAIIRTPIFEKTGLNAAEVERFLEDGKFQHPIGRIGETIDVAEAISYVASDCASFVTGILLPVDGGFMIK